MTAVRPTAADADGQALETAGLYGTSTASGGVVASATASDLMSCRAGEVWPTYGTPVGTSPSQYGT